MTTSPLSLSDIVIPKMKGFIFMERFPSPEQENSGTENQNEELLPEMSPEDFQEMIGQIPALEEMLREREKELERLKRGNDEERMRRLNEEIEELKEEIDQRKHLADE